MRKVSPIRNNGHANWGTFVNEANHFLNQTEKHSLRGINPGGYYKAIWCRDAAYILRDWFLTGAIDDVLDQIRLIWSHQIDLKHKSKLIYGRGSPDKHFLSKVASTRTRKHFVGALPTTIYQEGYSEIYGKNPDIDSTALMISTTSWILNACMSQEGSRLVGVRAQQQFPDPKVLEIIDFVVPRMFKAIDYLNSRDYDSDGLLEQDHNEDWMDTALRAGKIVYSQACWILALKDFSTLLLKLDHKKEAQRLTRVSQKTIQAVEQRLWSQDDEAFIDIQERHHIGRRYRTLTQDVCLYLIALTQGSRYEKSARGRIKSKRTKASRHETSKKTLSRAINTLDAIKERIWNGKWPLITEADLARTGPWILKPNVYHNHTFWPWSTGMEMIARGRFNQVRECEWLLSRVMSGKRPKMLAFYEWVDPRNGKGHGAYPFRTGISGIRIALHEMVESEVRARKSRTTSKQKHLYRAAAS